LKTLLESNHFDVKKIGYFGRRPEESPINEKNKYRLSFVLVKILYRLRAILPVGLLLRAYSWYFGANKNDEDGTWLRVIAGR